MRNLTLSSIPKIDYYVETRVTYQKKKKLKVATPQELRKSPLEIKEVRDTPSKPFNPLALIPSPEAKWMNIFTKSEE